MRLFVGDPVWTPHNRPNDHLPARYCDFLVVAVMSSVLHSPKSAQLYIALWIFLLLCRKEYLKSFVEKEAGIQTVNAAAWNLPTWASRVWNQVSGYQNMLLFVWSGMHVLSRVFVWLVMLCYASAYAKTHVFLFGVFHVVSKIM